MATLTPTDITGYAGTALAYTAATAGGDAVAYSPGKKVFLLVNNGDSSSKTVTLAVPGTAWNGGALPDTAVTVVNGTVKVIPVDERYADSSSLCQVTYSAVTSVTVMAVAV